MRLVPRVVDAGNHLRYPVLVARELADDDVVLVIARCGHDEVGWTLHAGLLQHEELGRITVQDLMLELLLELRVAVAALLDQRHLVPEPDEAAREVRADLPTACHEHVHQPATSRAGTSQARPASVRTSIAVEVGYTVRSPRDL